MSQILDTVRKKLAAQACVLAISGAGGSGQTTQKLEMAERFPGCAWTTITTRPPREGEQHGVDYHFMSKEEFQQALAAGEMAWGFFAENGTGYGASRLHMEAAQEASGGLAVICVNPGFQAEIAQYVSEDMALVQVHLISPHTKEQRRRLEQRGDEQKTIAEKIARTGNDEVTAIRLGPELGLHLLKPASIDETHRTILRLLYDELLKVPQ